MVEVIFMFDGCEVDATIDDMPKTGNWVRAVGGIGWFSVGTPGFVSSGPPRFPLRQQVPLEQEGAPSFKSGRWEFHPGYRSNQGV